MSRSKLSIWAILKHHFSTFTDEAGKPSYFDWFLMFVVPLFVSILLCSFSFKLSDEVVENIVTVGSILAGLLLNLLLLIYEHKTKLVEQKIKGDDPNFEAWAIRKKVIDEVHYNISYSILVSLFTVIFAVLSSLKLSYSFSIHNSIPAFDIVPWAIDLPMLFLSMHLILSVIMILKRVHNLMVSS